MIVKTKSGYQVRSEHGKALSKDGLSHKEAVERLKQVEMFKHMESLAAVDHLHRMNPKRRGK